MIVSKIDTDALKLHGVALCMKDHTFVIILFQMIVFTIMIIISK